MSDRSLGYKRRLGQENVAHLAGSIIGAGLGLALTKRKKLGAKAVGIAVTSTAFGHAFRSGIRSVHTYNSRRYVGYSKKESLNAAGRRFKKSISTATYPIVMKRK